MKFKSLATLGMAAAIAAFASPRAAQAQGKGNQDIPQSSRPPAGMCRIWLDNVPAAQQPAPTDCATAVRNRPAKGRVIFGDDYAKKTDTSRTTTKTQGAGVTKTTNPGIKGFAPSSSKTTTKKPPLSLP